MKLVMTLWKEDPLKCRGLPEAPLPFSPASILVPRLRLARIWIPLDE